MPFGEISFITMWKINLVTDMRIYNLLFIHVYELALRSKSNRDMPMFIVISVITLCFMFNIGSIVFLLQGLQLLPDTNLFPKSKKPIPSGKYPVR